MIYELFVGNILTFDQNISTNIHGIVIEQKLSLVDSFTESIKLNSVRNTLSLNQHIDVVKILNLNVTNNFNLTQGIGKGPLLQVFDFAFFYHIIDAHKAQPIISLLNLSQILNVVKGYSIKSTLTLTQTIGLIKSITQNITQNIGLNQHLSYYFPNKDFILNPDTIDISPNVILTYQTTSVQLRNPDFGNRDSFSYSRIMRRTRAGNLIVFRDQTWPASRTFSFTFSALKPDIAEQLLSFMEATIGKSIQVLDYENRLWDAIIMTPAAEVSEQFRNAKSITLDFQGQLI